MALSIYIINKKKKDLKAKEELWKHSNISPCQNIIFKKKNPLKEKTKILQEIYIITL
jgi:hypothetical protein